MAKSTNVSFSADELKKVLQEAADAALAKAGYTRQGHATKPPKDKIDIDALVIRQFKKAGFSDVQPRVNVMTYDKWLAIGMRVKKGERSVKCRQFRLFHVSQVAKDEPAPSEAVPAAPVAEPAKKPAPRKGGVLRLPFKNSPEQPKAEG